MSTDADALDTWARQAETGVRDAGGRLLSPLVASGVAAGLLLMWATGLLISL